MKTIFALFLFLITFDVCSRETLRTKDYEYFYELVPANPHPFGDLKIFRNKTKYTERKLIFSEKNKYAPICNISRPVLERRTLVYDSFNLGGVDREVNLTFMCVSMGGEFSFLKIYEQKNGFLATLDLNGLVREHEIEKGRFIYEIEEKVYVKPMGLTPITRFYELIYSQRGLNFDPTPSKLTKDYYKTTLDKNWQIFLNHGSKVAAFNILYLESLLGKPCDAKVKLDQKLGDLVDSMFELAKSLANLDDNVCEKQL